MIISSKIITEKTGPQPDGRSYITEEHITDGGKHIEVHYLSEDDGGEENRMMLRVPQLEEQEAVELEAKKDSVLLDVILDKHADYISSISIAVAKTVFNLTTDEQVSVLKGAF